MNESTPRPRLLSTSQEQSGKRQTYPYRPDGSPVSDEEMLTYLHRESDRLWKSELRLRREQHETAEILKRVKAQRARTRGKIERYEHRLERERGHAS